MARDYIGELQKQSTTTAPSNQGAFTNAIQKTGAFDIPVLGGLLRGVAQPAATLAEAGAEDIRAAGQKFSGQKGPYQPAFISPEMQQALISPEKIAQVKQNPLNAVKNAAGYELTQLPSQAGAVLDLMGLSSLAKTGIKAAANPIETAKNVAGVRNYVTRGRTYGQMEKLADKGRNIDYEDISKIVNSEATHKPTTIKNEISQILREERPLEGSSQVSYGPSSAAPQGGITQQLTPSQLTSRQALELRGEMGRQAYDKSVLVSGTRREAAKIINRALSKELKQATPGLATADKIYAFHKTLEKVAPGLLKYVGIGSGIAGAGGLGMAGLNIFRGDQNNP